MDESIMGVPVICSKYIVSSEWIQKRTHRKKRINKKWRKRYGFIHPPLNGVNVVTDAVGRKWIYVHPRFYKKIKKLLDGGENNG